MGPRKASRECLGVALALESMYRSPSMLRTWQRNLWKRGRRASERITLPGHARGGLG
jgi:hypothetical protein